MIVSKPTNNSIGWWVEFRPTERGWDWVANTEEMLREWCDANEAAARLMSAPPRAFETIVYAVFKTESDAMLCYMAFA